MQGTHDQRQQTPTGQLARQGKEQKVKNDRFDELTKGLAQSVTRRAALKRFGVGLAALALARFLVGPAAAQVALRPPVEISFPNPLVGCDNGLNPGGTWTLLDAAEPSVAVNPLNPRNIVAAW